MFTQKKKPGNIVGEVAPFDNLNQLVFPFGGMGNVLFQILSAMLII